MPWSTLDKVKARIAADNQKRSSDDLAIDDLTLSSALESGKRDILLALGSRGYRIGEIEAGDGLEEHHLNQSLFHAYFFCGVPHNYDLRQLEGFDRTKRIADPKFGWLVAGSIIWPGSNDAAEPGGSHGYGMLNTAPPLVFATWH